MKPWKIVRNSYAKDGREVILRTPEWEYLDNLLELINSLFEEGATFAPSKCAIHVYEKEFG